MLLKEKAFGDPEIAKAQQDAPHSIATGSTEWLALGGGASGSCLPTEAHLREMLESCLALLENDLAAGRFHHVEETSAELPVHPGLVRQHHDIEFDAGSYPAEPQISARHRSGGEFIDDRRTASSFRQRASDIVSLNGDQGSNFLSHRAQRIIQKTPECIVIVDANVSVRLDVAEIQLLFAVAGSNMHEFGHADHFVHDARRSHGLERKREIEFTGKDSIDQPGLVISLDLAGDARVRVTKGMNGHGHHGKTKAWEATDAQMALRPLPKVFGQMPEILDSTKDLVCFLEEYLRLRGRLQPALDPGEQLETKGSFGVLQDLACRRLRYAKIFSSPADRSRLLNGVKDL
jgi:hypothetical protein